MPTTPPWHDRAQDAFHDHTECVFAETVPAERRIEGDGGKPRCHVCARLAEADRRLTA